MKFDIFRTDVNTHLSKRCICTVKIDGCKVLCNCTSIGASWNNGDGIHFPVSLRFFHHFTFSSLVFLSCAVFFSCFCSCYTRVNYLLSLCCVAFFHSFLSSANVSILELFEYFDTISFTRSIRSCIHCSSYLASSAAERKTFYFFVFGLKPLHCVC